MDRKITQLVNGLEFVEEYSNGRSYYSVITAADSDEGNVVMSGSYGYVYHDDENVTLKTASGVVIATFRKKEGSS